MNGCDGIKGASTFGKQLAALCYLKRRGHAHFEG